jgi:hypothetical protein
MLMCLKKGYYVLKFVIGTANRDILTKELSKICKFFVPLCMRILFAKDKSSLVLTLVLSQDTFFKIKDCFV